MGAARSAQPPALARFLERFPETRTVDVLIPDLGGVARGKRLTLDAFTSALEHGLSFASSIYGLDTTGANVDASGLVWEEGDADRPCIVDWATLAPVPWRDGGAQVIGVLGETGGGPFFADPRAVLAGAAEGLASLGFRAVSAIELEFHLLDRAALERGEIRPPCQADGRTPSDVQVYGIDELDDRDAFLDELFRITAAQGIPAKSAVAEYAPGQYEINLGHVDDPVRAGDHAFLLKRAVRAAARAIGLEATFMAKPFPDGAASGMHVHVSLLDCDGANAFATDETVLRHAIGGLSATMAEAMLIFAPNANSYRRLRPRSYAPLAPSWGFNNRTVALRVPASDGAGRRIEHRTAGADANPYLVLAAVLAGVRHGLEQELDPGPPVTGDAYARIPASLPGSWERAIDAFAGARVLRELWGGAFCDLYRACRVAEREHFEDVVTPTEYAWYLRTV